MLVMLEKIVVWVIIELDFGLDVFGGMKIYVICDGEDYIFNGYKIFIINGLYVDVLVVYVKFVDGEFVLDWCNCLVLVFVFDVGMLGLMQGKLFKKMGMMFLLIGELFFDNVWLILDCLFCVEGDGCDSVCVNFVVECFGVVFMLLGIINECYWLCVDYVKICMLWGCNIGQF